MFLVGETSDTIGQENIINWVNQLRSVDHLEESVDDVRKERFSWKIFYKNVCTVWVEEPSEDSYHFVSFNVVREKELRYPEKLADEQDEESKGR